MKRFVRTDLACERQGGIDRCEYTLNGCRVCEVSEWRDHERVRYSTVHFGALMQMEELIRVANVLHETIYAALDAGYIVKRTNPTGYFLQNPKTKNVFAVNLDAKNEGIFVNINKNSFEEYTKPSIAKVTVDKILDWITERDTDMRKE